MKATLAAGNTVKMQHTACVTLFIILFPRSLAVHTDSAIQPMTGIVLFVSSVNFKTWLIAACRVHVQVC